MGKSAITQWLNMWLTKEQMALVKKVLGVNLPVGKVPISPGIALKYGIRLDHRSTPPIATKYGLPLPTATGSVRLYFTPLQKTKIRSFGIKPCDFAELRPTMHMKYGLPLNPGKP